MPTNTSPAACIQRLVDEVSAVFIGKEEVVANAVLALVCGGHVLIEDVPGLGKTLLAKALARALQADFKRVQFTADLLPSDVTGVTMYSQDTHQFTFRPGPLFSNIVLADEINRATPRTQSSLLEAMEEGSVTVDGIRHALPSPFFVIATQNPVELEGTYPLPFAQMDRFMVRLSIGYLDRANEIRLLRQQQEHNPLEEIRPTLTCEQLEEIRHAVRHVTVDESLAGYLVDIVNATRKTDGLEYGASPRGSLDLQRFSQAAALLDGRDYVIPDDIKRAARLILPHRLIIRKGTRSVSLNATDVIDRVLESIAVPV
ncbi:MAG: MoxR family ATPase [Verrucomicrobiae bacterium]|nr:MoxR family ATPase [Verrucomicrobiae bacterium]